MIEIFPSLFIGDDRDVQPKNWWVVHAAKEPYHRRLLGYKTRGAPRNHPEYLFARRDKRLYLNLVDVNNPAYIDKKIIDAAIGFIKEGLKSGKVLVHCNMGQSRSAGIGMLYLAPRLPRDFAEAEKEFIKLYPDYAPAGGMRGFMRSNWTHYAENNNG